MQYYVQFDTSFQASLESKQKDFQADTPKSCHFMNQSCSRPSVHVATNLAISIQCIQDSVGWKLVSFANIDS